jgi:hypothetical protein
MAQVQVPQQPGPTRARFEFAARTHRERIHSEVSDKPGARRCQEKMNMERTFFIEDYFADCFCSLKTMLFGCVPFLRQSSTYNTK